MKILFLQDDFPPHAFGGSATVAYTLAKALHKEGHDVFVITAVQDKKEAGVVEFEGLKVFRVHAAYHERWRAYVSLHNPQTVGEVKKVLERVKPDVVHAHNIHQYLSYHCLKLAKRAGAKVFLTAHDAMLFHYGKVDSPVSAWGQLKKNTKRYNPLRNVIIKRYLCSVDKIFVVSNALKDILFKNDIRNVEVLYNGIDVTAWELPADEIEQFKSKLQLANKKIILFGGRLSAAKGGEQAIRMMQVVVRKVPEALLVVMGTKNKYAEEMVDIARTLGVENYLRFTGWLSGEELKAAYHASDVLLVPSVYLDPLPTVVLEAMACRKPVVATSFGGAKEMVEDGETGYVVDPTQLDLLAEKITFVLSDQTLESRLGARGYERVQKEFTLVRQVERLSKWYMMTEL